jgi:hypothetical protein
LPALAPEAARAGARDDGAGLDGDLGLAEGAPSLRLLLHTDKLRESELGVAVGKVLKKAAAWRDLFEKRELEPVRDVDRLLIATTDARDSHAALAVVKLNLSEPSARSAFQALSEGDPGAISSVQALPAPGFVVVTPRTVARGANVKRTWTHLPASNGELATLYVPDPGRLARSSGIALPDGLLWLRATLELESDGAVRIVLSAGAADKTSAKARAEDLNTALRGLGAAREVALRAQGKRVVGNVVMNAGGLVRWLGELTPSLR